MSNNHKGFNMVSIPLYSQPKIEINESETTAEKNIRKLLHKKAI
jgi:hypothetical protein